LALCAGAHAQRLVPSFDHANNSITVTVRDSQNKPVPGARVDVRSVMGGQFSNGGYTNNSGVYEVAVPDGQYEVVAQKALLQDSQRTEVNAASGLVALKLDDSKVSDVGDATSVTIKQFQVPKEARKQLNKAQEAVDKRDMDEAAKRLAKALEIDPDFAEALTLRAIIALESHQSESAMADLDHAIKADPGYSLAYLAMGSAFNLDGKYDEALRVLDRGVALAPQSWQGYFEIGKAQLGKQQYAQAIKSLDRADSLAQGSYAAVHLVKAHALLALKLYPDAMNELQAFIDHAPKSPQADNARETLQQVKAYVAQQ
jgi:tetratricopeptide (TPR) repeat protein